MSFCAYTYNRNAHHPDCSFAVYFGTFSFYFTGGIVKAY